VTGVDLSPEMLDIARERAAKEASKSSSFSRTCARLGFEAGLTWSPAGSIASTTSWRSTDLSQAFRACHVSSIRTASSFLMSTLFGPWLWSGVREPCYVHLDSRDLFLVSVPQYDPATRIASPVHHRIRQRERTMGEGRRSSQGARVYSQRDKAVPEESRSP